MDWGYSGKMSHLQTRRKAGQTVYLHKSKRKDGRVTWLLPRIPQRRQVKMRTVESLGYLDELEKQFDDPIAHFKAVCDEA